MLPKILEAIPSLSTAAFLWREVLGQDHEIFESHWLVPTERPFLSYICRACGDSHQVVMHSKADIVSVPPSESHCERRPLDPEDVRIHEFDLTALGRALCRSFGIDEDQAVLGRGAVQRLGWIGQSQSQYPVYMLLKNLHQAAAVAKNLLLEEEQPFVLFSGANIPAIHHQFKRRNCALLSLGDVIRLNVKGLVPTTTPKKFLNSILPILSPKTKQLPDFPGDISNREVVEKLSTKMDAVVLPNAMRGSKTKQSASEGGKVRSASYTAKYDAARKFIRDYHKKNSLISFTEVRKRAADKIDGVSLAALKNHIKKSDFPDW